MLAQTEWLAARVGEPGLVVLDMRWRGDGSARRLYEDSHVPGALFLDWSADIVDPDARHAFMLAPPERFAHTMERLGIGDGTNVVAYTDEGGSGPFRLWWACRVHGHDNVRVLDGGLETWIAEGRPLEQGLVDPEAATPGSWTLTEFRAGLVATANDVLAGADGSGPVVLDSRPGEQFRGEFVWFESGPIAADADGIARTPRGDLRAGRVPWARSVPAAELYRPDDTFKSSDELRELFASAGVGGADRRVVTYCGVGISASALAFGLTAAGYSDVAVYDASWDEWGRDPTKPVARG